MNRTWPRAQVEIREARYDGLPLALGRVSVVVAGDSVMAFNRWGTRLLREALLQSVDRDEPEHVRLTVDGGDVWVIETGCGCG